MAGIILIGLSAIILFTLFVISIKTRRDNQSQLNNQQRYKIEQTAILTDLSIEDEETRLESENNTEVDDEHSTLNDLKSYSPKSYKDDEEYKRMASLVKNIYFSLVAVVFVILGALYVIFFKFNS